MSRIDDDAIVKTQSVLDLILSDLSTTKTEVDQILAAVQELSAIKTEIDQILSVANQILAILTEPAPITGANITLAEKVPQPLFSMKRKINAMLKQKPRQATVDFQLLDNGTATGTISFVDAALQPTTVPAGSTVSTTLSVSDPGITATIDSTGLVMAVAPASPLPSPLPTGVTITATITITEATGTVLGPFTAVSQAIDLVAGGPAGASIVLS